MIPLTPVQILCGGWGFLPSPGAVFATPHRIHPGLSAVAVQWPTGVMEYGLGGAWGWPNFHGGLGVRYLGLSAPLVTAPEDTLAPTTGTYALWSVLGALEAFRLVGLQLIREEQVLSGIYRTSQWDLQVSLTPAYRVPFTSVRVEGLLQGRVATGGWRGGVRLGVPGHGMVQFTAGTDRWPHQGGCGAVVTSAGWIGAGGQRYPGWGSLWGVGGGLNLGAFQVSWAYVFHPYGRALIGAALTWMAGPSGPRNDSFSKRRGAKTASIQAPAAPPIPERSRHLPQTPGTWKFSDRPARIIVPYLSQKRMEQLFTDVSGAMLTFPPGKSSPEDRE